ncbi:MAG TPA: 3-deoxy-D-manno-octulosonic acid transferase [Desulfatiglandales bacterium]|nr:3-deoxy-D-manno-octulosonic acid transferase [Desulfatiglandales bacterium]
MKAVDVFFFIYNLAWTFILLSFLPISLLTKSQWFDRRLALNLPSMPFKGKTIWIHALSVGEVISALTLLDAIKRQYPSRAVVFTVKTAQGMEVAREKIGGKVDLILPMPLDCWWAIRRLVNHIDPSVLLLVEGDIWPGLLYLLKKRGIKAILINGRISPKTYRHYKSIRFFSRRLLGHLEMCLMQSDLDRDRLLKIGQFDERSVTVGNIKFDGDWRLMDDEERGYWVQQLHLRPENRIWVSGSTHEGEEEIIFKTYKRLENRFPDLVLIIAPRRIERAEDVYRLAMDMGLKARRRTNPGVNGGHPYNVLILDTLGELGRIYGLADISFVGGSMVPVGGHNLLEPASFGCPVLFGSHTHNFLLMSQLLIEAGGGKRIKSPEDLFITVQRLLLDEAFSDRMGLSAREFVQKNSGAVKRVMKYIGGYIESA